jgi:hypothetical protein
MRTGILLFCMIFLAAFHAWPGTQNSTVAAQARVHDSKQPLQLTTTIVSLKFCRGDAELNSLQIGLQLKFTNAGRQNLILYKGSNLISRIMISRNLKDLMSERLEVNSSLTQVTEMGTIQIEGLTPSKLFTILRPRASYKLETTISVLIAQGNTRGIAGAITDGEHLLQIEVPTWPSSDGLAKKLHNLWQRSGYLWYEPIISIPMPFKVKKDHTAVDCAINVS